MIKLSFREIQLSDKPLIEGSICHARVSSCQLSFANLFCLKEKYGTEVCVDNDTLFIRQTKRLPNGKMAYFLPINCACKKENIYKIIKAGLQQKHEVCFCWVFEKDKDILSSLGVEGYVIENSPNWSEYMYESSRLFHLDDPKLRKIRRGINQFWSLYDGTVEVEEISASNLTEIKAFQDKWQNIALEQTDAPASLCEEGKAIQSGLDNFAALDLSGVAIRIDGRIEAYSYGCVVNEDTFDVIVQKANKSYRHIYKVLFHESLRTYWGHVRWTNMEEDIGLEGLRQLKTSYKPDYKLEKYIAIPCVCS